MPFADSDPLLEKARYICLKLRKSQNILETVRADFRSIKYSSFFQ
jgi:hypothetical protein